MTKKSLSPKVVKNPITSQYSLKERKEARDIAITDLINSLKKLKPEQTLRFGDLGTFEKTEHQIKSKFNNQSQGKIYQWQV